MAEPTARQWPIPLPGGRTAWISVPFDYTLEDQEFVLRFLGLLAATLPAPPDAPQRGTGGETAGEETRG